MRNVLVLVILSLMCFMFCYGQNAEQKQQDPYKVLGIERSATADEIKSAYKKLAIKYHPDRNKDNVVEAQKKFIEIGRAYDILKDENKKRQYDMFGFGEDHGHYDGDEENPFHGFQNGPTVFTFHFSSSDDAKFDPFELFRNVFGNDEDNEHESPFDFLFNPGHHFVEQDDDDADDEYIQFESPFHRTFSMHPEDDSEYYEYEYQSQSKQKKPKSNQKVKQLPEISSRDYKLLFEQAHQTIRLSQNHPQLHHAHVVLIYQNFPNLDTFDQKQQQQTTNTLSDLLYRLMKNDLIEEIQNQLLHIHALALNTDEEVRQVQNQLTHALRRGNAYTSDSSVTLPLIVGRSVDMKIHTLNDHSTTINKATIQQFIQSVLLTPRPLLQPDIISIKTYEEWKAFNNPSKTNDIRTVDTRVRMILFSRHEEPVLLEKEIMNKYYLFINFAHVHVDSPSHWIKNDPNLRKLLTYASLPAVYVLTPSLLGLDQEPDVIVHTHVTKSDLFGLVEVYGYGPLPILFTEYMIWDYCGDYEDDEMSEDARLCVLYSHSYLESDSGAGAEEFRKHIKLLEKLSKIERDRPTEEPVRFGIIPHHTSFSKYFVENKTDTSLSFMLLAVRPKRLHFSRFRGKVTETKVDEWLSGLLDGDLKFSTFQKFDLLANRYLPSAYLHPIEIMEAKKQYGKGGQLVAAISNLVSAAWYWLSYYLPLPSAVITTSMSSDTVHIYNSENNWFIRLFGIIVWLIIYGTILYLFYMCFQCCGCLKTRKETKKSK